MLFELDFEEGDCPEHGVLSVVVPRARQGSGFTLFFEALVMLLCREPERSGDRLPHAARMVTGGHQMPTAAVADTLREHDTRLWRVAAHYVEAAHAKNSWAKVRAISVDETSARRGHPAAAGPMWTNVLNGKLMIFS